MPHSAEPGRPRAAYLAAFLTVLLLTNGCYLSGGDADANAIQVARETLQSELESLKKRNDGSAFHSTLIRSLEDGIAKLSRTPDGTLEGPLVVEAGINADAGDPSGRRWRLGFQWVELGFSVTGFYVTDADGTVTDYVDCLSWDASDEKFLAGTAWRETWFPAITRADDTSWEGVTLGGVPVRAPVILPDCDLSDNALRLGLITKQGRQPATVPVAIQDSIVAQQ